MSNFEPYLSLLDEVVATRFEYSNEALEVIEEAACDLADIYRGFLESGLKLTAEEALSAAKNCENKELRRINLRFFSKLLLVAVDDFGHQCGKDWTHWHGDAIIDVVEFAESLGSILTAQWLVRKT